MAARELPTSTVQLLVIINQSMSSLVAVDKAIFRFSFRNLFGAIDYARYHALLDSETNALEELEVGLRLKSDRWKSEVGEPDFALVLTFLGHLKRASAKLRDITGNLALKAPPYAASSLDT